MPNYAQNVANKRYITNDQRLRNLRAFRRGAAYVALWQYVGVKGADEIVWALSKATKAQQIQWLEWYVDKFRVACYND